MAKELKKKSRRLKRTVRKVLGTICLVSAILVASIPTEGLKQVSADVTVSANSIFDETEMKQYYSIPDLAGDVQIYTTGDGTFQFAYVAPDGTVTGPTRVAVILGYNSVGSLEGGTLTIPDTVDAYLNYRTTEGTAQGYVAVGQSGNYLFYRVVQTPAVTDPSSGNVVTPETYAYNPCYYKDYDSWKDLDASELYYYPTSNYKPNGSTDPVTTDASEAYMRIKDAVVAYIGNQYLAVNENGDGGWKIKGDVDKEHGIFASKGSIVHLVVGENLSGIGNYAFYNCTALQSISLSNALDTIGNYAFAGCYNMSTVTMDLASDITAIGTHAFEDCQALTTITIPINVTTIGDAAFKGCWNLQSIDLCGQGQNVALRNLGCDMFVNCRNLRNVTFPQGFVQDVDISNFEGCLALQSITVRNTIMNITENFGQSTGTPSFGYEDFKKQYTESSAVQGTFYFEGPTNSTNPSKLHETAKKNYFAFSYLSDIDLSFRNIYELTVDAGNNKQATYRVNNQNQLIETVLDDEIKLIDLPEQIGPYYISTINSGVFKDYCSLERLIVPATVQNIASEAFIGCHELKHVVFENPSNLSIGERAFQTQEVSTHKESCPHKDESLNPLSNTPTLTFTGPISTTSAPFLYAMDPANKINTGTQKRSYITYYSGWPQNLTVQYNPETDKNELVDYPTLTDLSSYDNTYGAQTSGEYVYPYMTGEYVDAMKGAYNKKTRPAAYTDPMTEDEQSIWDAVMNIELPEGIEGIQEGLFKKKEVDSNEAGNSYFTTVGATYKSLTAYGLQEVTGDTDPDDSVKGGCFADWTTLSKVALYGNTISIGDYAFEDCVRLENVTLPETVMELGKIPFKGCEMLSYVNFQGSPYFTCDNSIIYQTDSAGTKFKLVEYLEGRESGSITTSEVETVTTVAEEAFAGTKVSFVDLSTSMIKNIPVRAFADCAKLIQVVLPDSVTAVESQAFTGCNNLQRITIPGVYTVFRVDAMDTAGHDPQNPSEPVFVCNEGSLAYEYAKTYGFIVDTNGVNVSYKVEFKDWDGTELKVEYVIQGKDATPPATPKREGYDFVGWSEDYTGISKNMTIYAMYETENPDAKKVTVTFYDDDQTTVLATRRVTIGDVVELPADPVKEGYVFIGWIGDVTAPITQPTSFYAKFEEKDGRFLVQFIDHDGTILSKQMVEPGEAPIEPKSPTREGYTFAGWLPSDFSNITKDTDIYATYTKDSSSSDDEDDKNNKDDKNDKNDKDDNKNNSKLYTLTVQNGSGSGSYVAGSQPIVVANEPASGKQFSHWTIDPAGTKIASTSLTATVITMPEHNVTVTANYKDKTTTSTGGNSSSNNNSSNKPNSNSGAVSNGTSVIIDKNGLSNTGVVSATVKGSSDNFVIKITESSVAAEAALKALQSEYGNVDNVKYFPMDITLYDATGTKKITDTTGLTISITLPLPDSLITYAGNNKVAGVVNNKLDKLSAKFTTIDGVSCITFTAEHFSPYVIYVKTDSLSASVVTDNTPKTGDGIHPKWFLSLGLACISVVLFMKKDKRTLSKVKTA